MKNTLDCKGWFAVITGGAGGVGRAIASRLIARGVHCLLVDVNENSLEQAIKSLGPMAHAHLADLTNQQSVDGLVERIANEFGRLDILVNNAGITNTTPFEQRPIGSILGEININLQVPVILTHRLLPLLRQARDGRVISIVSLGGIFPLPETSVYSATKFGLRGAMLCLGLDGPRLGVKFGIVNPSATETPMLIREAISGGNKLQFMDPPQTADEVAAKVIHMLDKPCLELYVRQGESWTVRLAMLAPNLLGRAIPMFRRQGEAGHKRYIDSLVKRGLIHQVNGEWQMR